MKNLVRKQAPLVLLVGAAIGAGAVSVLAADSDKPQLTLMRAGSRPLIDGPAENFTGKARIDRQVRPDDPSRPMGSMVYFEPGARTAWHTHPLGQTLIVISGCGWVQSEGGPEENDPAGRRDMDAAQHPSLAWRPGQVSRCRTTPSSNR